MIILVYIVNICVGFMGSVIVCAEFMDSFGPCWCFSSLVKFKAGKFMYEYFLCKAFFDQHLTEVQINTFHSLNT